MGEAPREIHGEEGQCSLGPRASNIRLIATRALRQNDLAEAIFLPCIFLSIVKVHHAMV